jgi:hypothetical protein
VAVSGGQTRRPDLVFVDDPQTDTTAASVVSCAKRERLLAGAVLGIAGPGQRIAALMPCTVIRKGDVADNILDRKKHPEWHGKRMKMLYAMPTNEKLWGEYRQISDEDRRTDGAGKAAIEFYAAHRATCGISLGVVRPCPTCTHREECMDAGAVVSWVERYVREKKGVRGELSALQHAMNILYLGEGGEAAFWAEYQNEPRPPEGVV